MPQLDDLLGMFYPDSSQLGKFKNVTRQEMPEVFQQLLAHSNHMTVTVEAFHQCPVDVEVIEFQWQPPIYRRKILLRRQSDQAVVQFGLVRLDTSFLSVEVRDEILKGEIPLGRVLIEHQVLRKVHLSELWEVACGPELARFFSVPEGSRTFGRTARIDFDGQAALQLLEIVAST